MDVQLLETRLTRRPYSPLFARLAEEYVSLGKIEDAKELCLSGLEKYPTYTTAHLILATCYAAELKYSSALQSLEYVGTVFHDSQIVNSLREEWKQRIHSIQPSAKPPAPDEERQPAEQISIIEEITVPVEEAVGTVETLSPPQRIAPPSEELTVTQPQAVNISQEELAQIERPATTLSEEGRIVSKTLAEIYVMQGEFGEAIITYQLLKQQRPERSADFDKRIEELEVKQREKMAGA